MEIIEDIQPQVRVEHLLQGLGGDRIIPQIREDAQWACNVVERQARPKAIFDIFQCVREGTEAVQILPGDGSSPVELAISSRGVELLAGAESVLISFVTLGDGLQQLADTLKNEGEMLKHYILDTASVFALYHAGLIVNHIAEKTGEEKNWGVSRRLSPGDLRGWSLEEQAKLASLLPIEKIGLKITAAHLLYPLKSASSLIGIGPDCTARRVGTVCQWCRNQKTCPIRMSGLDKVHE